MSPSKLGVFANLALAASAVLIPSTMITEDLGDDRAVETLTINPFKRSVAVECPKCAFATMEGESLKWKADAGSAFLLDFDVGPREDSLTLDGYQLYPPAFSLASQPFYVTQIDPASAEGLRLRVTGYEFSFDGAETISEAGTELLPMMLRIKSVEGTAVQSAALAINVLKDSEGRLMIASFNEAKPNEATPTDQEKECSEWPLLCKWKGIMADRIEKMKKMGRPGCHKRPHGSPNNPMAHEGKPHHHPHHRPHHHSHHGHHHHRFSMFLRRAFFTILVPIFIGVLAGTLTYVIGMALGCLIAVTMAKVRGQRYEPIALDEEDIEESEERSEKEEYAGLPAYEAPPVYEEAPVKEADEEAK
ncbi:hypothetical protein BDW02DRAFT_576500 [Decorospora gaudefroyi]|uniref:DUF7728 domain-containing protein n=1 Tax=Decorospora gaudefroyi TaxID=184978 RepID=A0A6A5KUJ9_9PLEO|nr:hypothetical protein BDW02DRAFT_576500 [Decorospora gaudefroyi]